MKDQPNVLFVMTDQQRFDTIAALGNRHIYTPNLDRLVSRGVSFTNAYSTCPVCVPARYTIRTGCEPPAIRVFSNRISGPAPGQADTIEGRCGPYLAKVMRQSATGPSASASSTPLQPQLRAARLRRPPA